MSVAPVKQMAGEQLMQEYFGRSRTRRKFMWFSILLVNTKSRNGTQTIIACSQKPLATTRDYNILGHRSVSQKSMQKRKRRGALREEWALVQVVGPMTSLQEARFLNSMWQEKSRGAVPRAAKAEVLADHFKLPIYGNLDLIVV